MKLSDIFPEPFKHLYYNDPKDCILINPRMTGKSHTLAHEMIYRLLIFESQGIKMDGLCIRKTHRSLEGSVVQEIKDAITFFGTEEDWVYKKQEKIFENLSGYRIYCSGSEAEYIKGIKPDNIIGYFYIDEVQQIKDLYELKNIMSTFSRYMNNNTYVRYSGNNVMDLEHWVYKFKEDSAKVGMCVHESTYKDIYHLLSDRAKKVIEDDKNTDYKMYEFMYKGKTDGLLGAIYDNLTDDNFDIKHFKDMNYDIVFCGIDDGNTIEEFATLNFIGKRGNNLYHYRSEELKGCSTLVISDKFAKYIQEEQQRYNVRVYYDSAALGLGKSIQERGVFCQPSIKGSGSVEEGIKILRGLIGKKQLFIHPNLKSVRKEYRDYRRDENNKIIDKNNHHMDGTRYAIYTPFKNGILKLGGF